MISRSPFRHTRLSLIRTRSRRVTGIVFMKPLTHHRRSSALLPLLLLCRLSRQQHRHVQVLPVGLALDHHLTTLLPAGIRVPRKVRLPSPRSLLSGGPRMGRRMARSRKRLDAERALCFPSSASKPVKFESSVPVSVASFSRKHVTRVSHVEVASRLMLVCGRSLVHVLISKTLATL